MPRPLPEARLLPLPHAEPVTAPLNVAEPEAQGVALPETSALRDSEVEGLVLKLTPPLWLTEAQPVALGHIVEDGVSRKERVPSGPDALGEGVAPGLQESSAEFVGADDAVGQGLLL